MTTPPGLLNIPLLSLSHYHEFTCERDRGGGRGGIHPISRKGKPVVFLSGYLMLQHCICYCGWLLLPQRTSTTWLLTITCKSNRKKKVKGQRRWTISVFFSAFFLCRETSYWAIGKSHPEEISPSSFNSASS